MTRMEEFPSASAAVLRDDKDEERLDALLRTLATVITVVIWILAFLTVTAILFWIDVIVSIVGGR